MIDSTYVRYLEFKFTQTESGKRVLGVGREGMGS